MVAGASLPGVPPRCRSLRGKHARTHQLSRRSCVGISHLPGSHSKSTAVVSSRRPRLGPGSFSRGHAASSSAGGSHGGRPAPRGQEGLQGRSLRAPGRPVRRRLPLPGPLASVLRFLSCRRPVPRSRVCELDCTWLGNGRGSHSAGDQPWTGASAHSVSSGRSTGRVRPVLQAWTLQDGRLGGSGRPRAVGGRAPSLHITGPPPIAEVAGEPRWRAVQGPMLPAAGLRAACPSSPDTVWAHGPPQPPENLPLPQKGYEVCTPACL